MELARRVAEQDIRDHAMCEKQVYLRQRDAAPLDRDARRRLLHVDVRHVVRHDMARDRVLERILDLLAQRLDHPPLAG
ncbi:MAG: hypothetical protein ABI678_01535 [Kofleriaceae bacterium]